MAKGLKDSGGGVADDGAAQMPNMHLLGEVGAGVIDHHPLRRQTLLQQWSGWVETGGEHPAAQANVEKTGAGGLNPFG